MTRLAIDPFARCIAVNTLREPSRLERRLPAHGQWSLWIAVSGAFRLVQGDTRVELATGDVALLRHPPPPEPTVELRAAACVELVWASFHAFANDSAHRELSSGAIHIAARDVANNFPLSSVLELLKAELTEPSAGAERLARSMADALFTYVARAANRRPESKRARLPALRDRQVARALELIREKPASRWTLGALAKAAGLSRAQFARRFVAELGVSPLRYLTLWRLQIAAEHLSDGDDSLATIAARVGYESEFAFNRAFKRFMGEAPGVFRRRMRSRSGATVALAMAA